MLPPNQADLILVNIYSLIAVTGLGGHAFGSWKSPISDNMWLRDYLLDDLPNYRVILYGYNTKLVGN